MNISLNIGSNESCERWLSNSTYSFTVIYDCFIWFRASISTIALCCISVSNVSWCTWRTVILTWNDINSNFNIFVSWFSSSNREGKIRSTSNSFSSINTDRKFSFSWLNIGSNKVKSSLIQNIFIARSKRGNTKHKSLHNRLFNTSCPRQSFSINNLSCITWLTLHTNERIVTNFASCSTRITNRILSLRNIAI